MDLARALRRRPAPRLRPPARRVRDVRDRRADLAGPGPALREACRPRRRMKRAAALLACLLAACAGDPPSIPPGLTKPRAAVLRAWSPAEGSIRVLAIDGIGIDKVSHV